MFGWVASIVVTPCGSLSAASRRWSTLTSSSVTCAPSPSAARAAARPSTPAPSTTKLAGGTPGTPPSRIPLPPNSLSSSPLPIITASAPAISDIDVSTGARPCVVLDRLEADRRDLALRERLELLGPRGRQAPEGEHHLALAQLGDSGGSGANTEATSAARASTSWRL